MISGGAFLGAQRPTHWLASKPLTKSPTVGISASASDRVAVVTAKARSLPALIYSIEAAMSVNVTWICPPSRSVIAGPAPRYGTRIRSSAPSRHGCGYALANAGHDTRALQAWLGHKNIQHTVRYTELAPDRFKNFWRD
jgi:hypothetical protein